MRILILLLVLGISILQNANAGKKPGAEPPHTPTLTFHLTGLADEKDAGAIRAAVEKLPSVSKVAVNTAGGCVQVRFDSHVVSYHQVAQAISEAGAALSRKYDPRLKITVPEYSHGGNAAKVDAIFAGKRLGQRVRIEPLDKTRGEFFIHFLPLELDPADRSPQGFNGGHLHHPISDPPPRGLGLPCNYEAEEAGASAARAEENPREKAPLK